MAGDLREKTQRYERLFTTALDHTDIVPPADTPLRRAAADHLEMARSYLEDGRHFREEDDYVNALASYSYGHGWIDAGIRTGLLVDRSNEDSAP